MTGMKVRYWEGRTPPAEYYGTPSLDHDSKVPSLNYRALVDYARNVGRKIVDLSYEEVQQFIVAP